MDDKFQYTRRRFVKTTLVFISALATGLTGKFARTEAASKPPLEVPLDFRLDEILNGKRPEKGKISLKIPPLVEDGSIVPTEISFKDIDAASLKGATISLIVDKNPDPLIFTFYPNPALGITSIATRIRMRESSRAAVYALTSDGRVYMDEVRVEVTAGGCE